MSATTAMPMMTRASIFAAARPAASVHLGEDQRGVGATKAERIGQGHFDGPLPRLVGHEVQIAAVAGMVQVDGGRRHLIAQGEYREDGLHRTRGTQQVSRSIEVVSEATAKTGAAADEVLAAASDLSTKADELRAEVDAFLGQIRAA